MFKNERKQFQITFANKMSLNTFLVICVVLVSYIDVDVLAIRTLYPRKFRDCDEIRITHELYGEKLKSDHEYEIFLNRSKPIKVKCRFEEGVTYTSLMQRFGGELDFKRSYTEYVNGFGSPAYPEFWMGLKFMHDLTSAGHNVLTVTLGDWSSNFLKLKYNNFYLGDDSDLYRLSIGGFNSSHNLTDDFKHSSTMQFTTSDKPDANNCAKAIGAGWWYNTGPCTLTLPTGHYYYGPYHPSTGHPYDGIFYKSWHGFAYSLMLVRLEVSTK